MIFKQIIFTILLCAISFSQTFPTDSLSKSSGPGVLILEKSTFSAGAVNGLDQATHKLYAIVGQNFQGVYSLQNLNLYVGFWNPSLSIVDDLHEDTDVIPHEFSLKQNYPNPFNPQTTIEYSLAHPSDVKITVYNIVGQAISQLVAANQSAGKYSAIWNGRNDFGIPVSSGLYFYVIDAKSNTGERFRKNRRMVLIK